MSATSECPNNRVLRGPTGSFTNNILLMRDCNHALVWKMADYSPELSENDLNMKTNLVIE